LLFVLLVALCFFFYWYVNNPHLHSFPTRRSSDLHQRNRKRIMSFTVRTRRSAQADIRAAARWYNQQRTGLGKDFVAEVKEVVRRSEEHTSELQSRGHLVCRLLLEKKTDNNTVCID